MTKNLPIFFQRCGFSALFEIDVRNLALDFDLDPIYWVFFLISFSFLVFYIRFSFPLFLIKRDTIIIFCFLFV